MLPSFLRRVIPSTNKPVQAQKRLSFPAPGNTAFNPEAELARFKLALEEVCNDKTLPDTSGILEQARAVVSEPVQTRQTQEFVHGHGCGVLAGFLNSMSQLQQRGQLQPENQQLADAALKIYERNCTRHGETDYKPRM